jgi:hypothetical protein
VATQVVMERAARAARHTRLFAVALFATLLVTALDLPWRLSGLAFGSLVIYAGVRLLGDLRALQRVGRPAFGRIAVVLGIGLTGLMLLVLLGEAALYPLVADQERCLAGALTNQDRQQCHLDFEHRQQELLRRFGRTTAAGT